ncbi:hypothetical protein F5X96DRAFT_668739 [Biscogniauxia mediterranea]|nr:hypothetical protein F5X96DRAFT_668739 [Biscogniauxia mediterranea]
MSRFRAKATPWYGSDTRVRGATTLSEWPLVTITTVVVVAFTRHGTARHGIHSGRDKGEEGEPSLEARRMSYQR